MNNNAIPKHLRRLESLAKKRKEIENCIQAMEYASDLYGQMNREEENNGKD